MSAAGIVGDVAGTINPAILSAAVAGHRNQLYSHRGTEITKKKI